MSADSNALAMGVRSLAVSNNDELTDLAHSAVACHACFSDGRLHRSFVDLAQPRYIGPGYRSASQKIAFVMLNPGAGQDDWRNTEWKEHIYRFRDEGASLESVFSGQRRHMPFWAGGKLISFVRAHGLDVDNLALVNIAWCATKENKYPVWMLKQCFTLHTMRWLSCLAADVIILSGTASHSFEHEIAENLPNAKVLTSFHYAHRPLDADRAMSRAREIADELNVT